MRKTMVLAGIVLVLGLALVGCPQVDQDSIRTLPAPTVTLDGSVISWEAVPGAIGYSVRIDGTQVVDGAIGPWLTSFNLATLGLGLGEHEVTVVALGDGVQTLGSPPSIPVTFTVGPTQLPAPQVTLVGAEVRWNAVTGAIGYSVRIGGEQVDGGGLGLDATSFNLAALGLGLGEHEVTVVALGDGVLILDSPPSIPVIFTVEHLTAPVITLDESTVRWNTVSEASGYSVRIDGTPAAGSPLGPAATSFDLATLGLGEGSYEITVVAIGVPGQSLNSPPSDPVTFVVPPQQSGSFSISFADLSVEPFIFPYTVHVFGTWWVYFDSPAILKPGSIRWMLGGRQLTEADGVFGTYGEGLMLGRSVHGNREGIHSVTVIATDLDGVTWSQLIIFTVAR